MPNYGPELNGDTVVSSTTVFNETFLSFKSLTVDSGAIMSVPHKTAIFCSGVLEVNGEIRVGVGQEGGEGGGVSGPANLAGDGGEGGGSLNIVSFVVQGDGKITANGGNGLNSSSGNPSNDDDGDKGKALRIPHETIDPARPTGPADGLSVGGESITEFFDLFVENRLLSGSFVTQQSIQQAIAGSGAGGAVSNDGQAKGGGGGGFGGPGGGGAVSPSLSTDATAPGGGGAGGQIIVMSENLAPDDNLTLQAQGGDGGKRANQSDGGGGGGGGGMIIALADRPASSIYDVAGGDGGPGAAADGGDGIAMRYPVSQF
jgi:hypothetical protein